VENLGSQVSRAGRYDKLGQAPFPFALPRVRLLPVSKESGRIISASWLPLRGDRGLASWRLVISVVTGKASRTAQPPQDEREPSARGGTDASVPPLRQFSTLPAAYLGIHGRQIFGVVEGGGIPSIHRRRGWMGHGVGGARIECIVSVAHSGATRSKRGFFVHHPQTEERLGRLSLRMTAAIMLGTLETGHQGCKTHTSWAIYWPMRLRMG